MIDVFEDTFVDEVWEGTSKTLWPLMEESPRNDHWKRRLRLLRFQFENEMKQLQKMIDENNGRRKEIESLQAHLFSGTSIQESRKSVELSDTTVQQGRNIKVGNTIQLNKHHANLGSSCSPSSIYSSCMLCSSCPRYFY